MELKQLQDELKDLKLQRVDDREKQLPKYKHLAHLQDKRLTLRPRRKLEGHFGKIYAFEWGPNSEDCVSAAQDSNMFVWNAMYGLKSQAITLPSSWVMCCGFSPSGQLVSTAGLDNVVWIYKVEDGAQTEEITMELTGHEGYISSCSFLSEKQMITTSGDCSAMLWDLVSRRPITEFQEHQADVNCCDLSSNGNVFATGSCDATLKLWDIRVGSSSTRTFVGHEADINAVTFFPDGNSLISGGEDSSLRLFDIRSYSMLNIYLDSDTFTGVVSSSVSKSGRYIFSSYESGPVAIWNTIDSTVEGTLDEHDKRVAKVRTAPNGTAVGTASWDSSVIIWA